MLRFCISILLLTFASGCNRDSSEDAIVSYRAPKDTPAVPTSAPAMMTMVPATVPSMPSKTNSPMAGPIAPVPTSANEITWQLPPGWSKATTGDASAQKMRFASLMVDPNDPSLTVSIIPLGPEAAELLPNITRWQGQIGMPPSASLDDAKGFVQSIPLTGAVAQLVDLSSPATTSPRQRILAAIVPMPTKTWFVKLQGPLDKVTPHADEFVAFLKSLTVNGPASTPTSDVPIVAKAPTASEGAAPHWTVPKGWTLQPAKPMRVATFATSNDAAHSASAIVTRFASAGMGGTLENINRWRGMVELKPLKNASEQPATTLTVGGRPAEQYEFAADANATEKAKDQKMIVIEIPSGAETWYLRFAGPATEVDAQRASFDAFVKSIAW